MLMLLYQFFWLQLESILGFKLTSIWQSMSLFSENVIGFKMRRKAYLITKSKMKMFIWNILNGWVFRHMQTTSSKLDMYDNVCRLLICCLESEVFQFLPSTQSIRLQKNHYASKYGCIIKSHLYTKITCVLHE